LVIGDVGQDKFEEIDFVPHGTGAGLNFGWNLSRGGIRTKIGPPRGGGAFPWLSGPLGGAFGPSSGGTFGRDRGWGGPCGGSVYGDDCRSRIDSVRLRNGGLSGNRVLLDGVDHLVSFGEDGLRRVYCVSLGGWVYRLGAGG